ncbi:hypothetical protein AOLI_G00083250 [Acnodon oligacanthus]
MESRERSRGACGICVDWEDDTSKPCCGKAAVGGEQESDVPYRIPPRDYAQTLWDHQARKRKISGEIAGTRRGGDKGEQEKPVSSCESQSVYVCERRRRFQSCQPNP